MIHSRGCNAKSEENRRRDISLEYIFAAVTYRVGALDALSGKVRHQYRQGALASSLHLTYHLLHSNYSCGTLNLGIAVQRLLHVVVVDTLNLSFFGKTFLSHAEGNAVRYETFLLFPLMGMQRGTRRSHGP